MLRTITRTAFTKNLASASAVRVSSRTMASKNIEDATQAAGEAKDTNPKVCSNPSTYASTSARLQVVECYTGQDRTNIYAQNPSAVSSGGAVGKQFNPDGAIGQVGEKIGGPFSKDGAIGMFYLSRNVPT